MIKFIYRGICLSVLPLTLTFAIVLLAWRLAVRLTYDILENAA